MAGPGVTDADAGVVRSPKDSPFNSRNVASCLKCGRGLGAGEPVYISYFGGAFGQRDIPACEQCAPPYMVARQHPYFDIHFHAHPCETCGRTVVFTDGVAYRYRKHVLCCERCRWTFYNRIRDEAAAATREKVCEACGKEFSATRRDAKTCSPACKQKAYRQRKLKLAQALEVDPAELVRGDY